jgi:hypothetical protein
MEIGETSIQLPTLSEINTEINDLVTSMIRKRLEVILIQISEQEQIPRDKLFKAYLNDADLTEKKQRKQILDDIKCNAFTASGARCSRKQKLNGFCGSHVKKEEKEIKTKAIVNIKTRSETVCLPD